MDLSAIGSWAGEHGPYVGIIALQWGIIWKLLNRFFAQQEIVMRAVNLADKTVEKATEK